MFHQPFQMFYTVFSFVCGTFLFPDIVMVVLNVFEKDPDRAIWSISGVRLDTSKLAHLRGLFAASCAFFFVDNAVFGVLVCPRHPKPFGVKRCGILCSLMWHWCLLQINISGYLCKSGASAWISDTNIRTLQQLLISTESLVLRIVRYGFFRTKLRTLLFTGVWRNLVQHFDGSLQSFDLCYEFWLYRCDHVSFFVVYHYFLFCTVVFYNYSWCSVM